MKKVLITGAAGMLGAEIANYMFKQQNYKIFATGRSDINASYTYIKANLLNKQELNNLLTLTQPDIIIHCAANVNLNDCELNKNDAYEIHVNATKKIASYKQGKCRFLYISTDSVFNGRTGNYSETDKPAPLNYYALSKLEGEKAVADINSNSLILRTNIYGFNRNKEGNSLFEWIYKKLNSNHSISGFKDVFFNPLYIGQLAELITIVINKNITGVLHAGCIEKISKYQFVLLIADAFGFNKSLINADISDTIQSTIKRPKNTTLNTKALTDYVGKNYSINQGINQLKVDFLQQNISHG